MIYRFGEFVLDTRRCELRSGDESLHLEPQVYAVLCHLVEHRDRLVRKEELLDSIWGHRFVAPATLNSRIRSLRRVLGDDGGRQSTVRTVRGVGFRFAAEVLAEPAGGQGGGRMGDERRGMLPAGGAGEGHGADRGVAAPHLRQHIHFCRGPDGNRIAYAVSGDGPVLVKPANWLTHLEHDWRSPVWKPWISELSRDHTLVRYDERGCGLSDRDTADLSFDSWVRDLEVLMDELRLERVPLLALSQGCALAVAYATRHPERVSRLVLYGGYPQGRFRRTGQGERMKAEAMLRMLPLGWGQDNRAFRDFFANIFLPEGTPEEVSWFSDLQRVSATAESAVRLWLACAEIDVCDEATRVRAPTLVIHATGDAVIPFEQGRMLAGLVPGARFVPIESVNHVLLEREPAWPRFLEEVRAFLAEEDAPHPPPDPARPWALSGTIRSSGVAHSTAMTPAGR